MIDLKNLVTFTNRPYQITPSFRSPIPPFHLILGDGDRKVIVNAFFSSPVVVRVIPTSPLVDIGLYRNLGEEGNYKVNVIKQLKYGSIVLTLLNLTSFNSVLLKIPLLFIDK